MKGPEAQYRWMGILACRALPPLFLIGLILSAGCTGSLVKGGAVVAPHIVPVEGAADPPRPSYSFPFEDMTVTLSMPVDGPVYAGAKAADKEVTIYGNVSESAWIAESYLSMINDPNQEPFYSDLQGQLRKVKGNAGLSDDEFVDLMAVFVQTIPYETTPENPAKFPIETFAEKAGDCDDKSLLLAALLSREGYRTALLSFPEESHMAVGIVCNGAEYRNTGYAYIETTNVSYVGVPPDSLDGDIVLNSNPIVIPVGNGNRTYGACDETTFLHTVYVKSENRFTDLTRQADSLQAELRALSGRGDAATYNREIAAYNSLIAEMKRVAQIHNYVAGHQYDRKGTYAWANSHPL